LRIAICGLGPEHRSFGSPFLLVDGCGLPPSAPPAVGPAAPPSAPATPPAPPSICVPPAAGIPLAPRFAPSVLPPPKDCIAPLAPAVVLPAKAGSVPAPPAAGSSLPSPPFGIPWGSGESGLQPATSASKARDQLTKAERIIGLEFKVGVSLWAMQVMASDELWATAMSPWSRHQTLRSAYGLGRAGVVRTSPTPQSWSRDKVTVCSKRLTDRAETLKGSAARLCHLTHTNCLAFPSFGRTAPLY
jgi:hypothetical protein